MRTELLAPAKNKEIAFAAIDCGADAVYIGAEAFGARQSAPNSLADIQEVICYAHKFNAKVFITVNTILTDAELDKAIKLVKELDRIGADAILIQDMGLLEKIIELGLKIPIHMSTQCDNRDKEKIKFWNDIGVARVVLARELSIEQIREIHEANPEMELECFIHGALCVSYSGQCYLSQYIGGRSANRGECAQPCRKKYSIVDHSGNIVKSGVYPLCLKDFNASTHIKDMIEAGVYSFKIEGRLKDVNYVKNVVSYYRQELDKYSQKISSGHCEYPYKPNPEKSFNRGFTDYFLEKRKDCYNFASPKSIGEYIGRVSLIQKDFIVLATDKQLHSQDGLCYLSENGLKGFLVNKADCKKIYPNKLEQGELKVGQKIYRNQDVEFEKLLSGRCKRQIGVSVQIKKDKKNDLCIFLEDEDGIKISVKFPEGEEAKNKQKMNESFVKQFSKTGESDFYIENLKIEGDIPFQKISLINELRRSCFNKLMNTRLSKYTRQEQPLINHKKYYKKELDYRANVHNLLAKTFYEKCGCNVKEFSMEKQIPNRQIELMRTKHCIKYALNMCKSPLKLYLQDEKGAKYPLQFDCKRCEMAVLSDNAAS